MTPETDKTIEIKIYECRPKGMGLGVDKLLNKKKLIYLSKKKYSNGSKVAWSK